MANTVRYECLRLPAGVAGKLKKDSEGYYTMAVGGLNVYNSSGQYYTMDGVKKIFDESSQFQRRVQRGVLRAEVGHPVREPGMTENDFIRRVLTIRESNVCAFFKEIWLDFNSVKDNTGRPVVAIMAKVCPSGPHGAMLERIFEQPGENLCFSIRAFTKDFREGGVYKRELETVVTFDYVNEPGIDHAEKFKAPALESAYLDTAVFTRGQVTQAVETFTPGMAQESTILTGKELMGAMGWVEKPSKPGYIGW